jgi:hypothetical protein
MTSIADATANFPTNLRNRVACISRSSSIDTNKKFVLYLPTVALRSYQNPSFATATRLAIHLNLPLVTVLNVAAPPQLEKRYLTPRRVAFLLEASAEACSGWSTAGLTFINIQHFTTSLSCPALHAQTLSCCARAAVVVTDEPFVDPHLSYVAKLEVNSPVAVLRVDSSTIVPPRHFWKTSAGGGSQASIKAWQW